ncbi:MAG TPA: trigger factor [Limnochordales bacterium]
MAVKASLQRMEGSKVALEVEVAPEEVQRSLQEAYRRLAERVRVPGFRPGRVPPQVLRARLGRQSIYDEALEVLLPRAYQQAVQEQGLEPVEEPRFDIVQMEEDKPLVFRAEVTVKPEVRLDSYRGLPAQRKVYEVTEADVDRVLRRLQERMAVLEPEEGPVRRGHFVELDYEALLDGKPFRGGAARGRTVEVGREQVAPGFDEAIEGMRPGEERSFQLELPADYPDSQLAGKRLQFRVTVHAVKSRRLPELDDELARDLGQADLGALRELVRRELEQILSRRADQELRRQVVDRLIQTVSVEVPEVMLRRRTDSLLQDLAERLARQGLTVERYLQLTGRSASELVGSVEPEARRQLVEEMVLDAVARAEGIEADPQEVERELQLLVGAEQQEQPGGARRGRDRQARARQQELREDLRRYLQRALRRQRAVDWLVAHAQVQNVPAEGGVDEQAEAEAAAAVELRAQPSGEAV